MDATEDDEHFESDEPDSDEELQLAFERGELKPGLNAIIPFVKKDATNNVVLFNHLNHNYLIKFFFVN